LILLVSEAKTDQELVTAVELASEFDADGCRTMQIYTKFDTFDTEEAKRQPSSGCVMGVNIVQEILLKKKVSVQSDLTPPMQMFQSKIAECKTNIMAE
jgi:hypothetical protein